MQMTTCTACKGSVIVSCRVCKGTGEERRYVRANQCWGMWHTETCKWCHGGKTQRCNSCCEGTLYICEESDLQWVYNTIAKEKGAVPSAIEDRFHFAIAMAVVSTNVAQDSDAAEYWLKKAHQSMKEPSGCVCGTAEWLGKVANTLGLPALADWFGKNTFCRESPQWRYGEPAAGVRSYANPKLAEDAWERSYHLKTAKEFLVANKGHALEALRKAIGFPA